MSSLDLGALTLGILALLVVGIVALVAPRFHRDEIFTGVTPGLFPPRGTVATRERIRGGQEYSGEVAVAFAPPRGLTPGLVGTVVDGVAHTHDVTATIVDLAVRGHLTITVVDPPPDQPKAQKDWELTRVPDETRPADRLSSMEARLYAALFDSTPRVRMSQLGRRFGQAMREAQVELYRQVVNRGWYPKHPNSKGVGWALSLLPMLVAIVFGIALIAVTQTVPGIAGGVMMIAAGVLLPLLLRGRTPRTAEGTAVRIQALGFKKYLATAEAEQFKFEEAADIFSRYLPYAIVFGVAKHWAKVFGEVAKRANDLGYDGLGFDLAWFTVEALDAGLDLAYWGAVGLDGFDGIELFDIDGLAALGGDAAEGLTAFTEGVGDFVGSVDVLDGLGDLGDGCSGCGDVGCIDF